mgnify:CR=1 FL=1
MNWAEFFTILGHISNIAGLATFFVSIVIYFKVQTETKKIRKTIREKIGSLPPALELDQQINYSEKINTLRPVAWAFSLTPTHGSIVNPVRGFLEMKKETTGVEAWGMPIKEIEMEGINTPQDIQDFYNQVRRKKRELEIDGYTEVHLFFSGPIPGASIVGCLLSNWMPVKLYHKPQGNPSYIYWMPLVKL